jgi:YbbR domain-containing protein
MDSVEQIKEDIAKKDKSKVLTFLVFLVISAVLWFLIKLTKEYTSQTSFFVTYTEVPVNKWVSTSQQAVKLSFVADGFITLRHNLVRKQYRTITIPLNEVTYRLEGGNTYSYSSQYVAERVADWLGVPTGSVTINDDKQFFNMEDLQSKELQVRVPLDVKTQRQYQVYGQPHATPSSITVYGPKNMLDTMTAVYTATLHAVNASEDVVQTLALDLYDGAVRSDVTAVEVLVDVEQYTEIDIEVPVKATDRRNLRFFPETVKVKCMVPIKDYASITGASFLVLADTAQLHQRKPLLDIKLDQVPENVHVVKTEPKQVEYLIIN